MKSDLPPSHGLPARFTENLVPRDESGTPSLTDVQYSALDLGVAHGVSMIVSSPTSTGKTLIGYFAIAHAIDDDQQAVYLVTHRALARQKFDEFLGDQVLNALNIDREEIILATGDDTTDATGSTQVDPRAAKILVATYEKYLAILSATGIPEELRDMVYVCDELQLVGDETRGQDVEVLLTLLRQARWGQFVGLSATISEKDLLDLSSWLRTEKVHSPRREKHIVYELWTPQQRFVHSTRLENTSPTEEGKAPLGNLQDTQIVRHVLNSDNFSKPLIIFCMHKPDAYRIADAIRPIFRSEQPLQLDLEFESSPPTEAHQRLAESLPNGIGIHTADLTDIERSQVEARITNGDMQVVVATSTLAAGVHYPFGTVLFAQWKRYIPKKGRLVAISRSEFHNMAGRAGRMGTEHESGKVVFFVSRSADVGQARRYLEEGSYDTISGHLSHDTLDSIILTLLAGGLCRSRSDIKNVICDTLTVLREQDRNTEATKEWARAIDSALDSLIDSRFVKTEAVETLAVTRLGRATCRSGVRPDVTTFILNYVSNVSGSLVEGLEKPGTRDWVVAALALLHAIFVSPMFSRVQSRDPQREMSYALGRERNAPVFSRVEGNIFCVDPAATDFAANASSLVIEWIEGAPIEELENRLEKVSAGILNDLFRNASWATNAVSNILEAVLHRDTDVPDIRAWLVPEKDRNAHAFALPRLVRRLARMALHGVPDSGLWFLTVEIEGQKDLDRREIKRLIDCGLESPEQCMRSDVVAEELRQQALNIGPMPPSQRSNRVRDSVRNWKVNQRVRAAERHQALVGNCNQSDLAGQFYEARGSGFEKTFEKILDYFEIKYERLDCKNKTGAPDYLVMNGDDRIVVELKSSDANKLINHNKSIEVLAASEVHGYGDAFCVTLCHPGVDPSVPVTIAQCRRLSVVESADLGEAFVRMCQGRLSWDEVFDWLVSPGQALASDIPALGR